MKKLFFIVLALQALPAFPQSGWFQQASSTSYSLNSLHFLNANTGYADGDNSVVVKTLNGGTVWSVMNNGPYAFWSCYMVDANTGYFGGASGDLLRTTNGGSTWTRPPHVQENLLHSIQFVDANTGYIAAGFGTILKTVNGTASFIFQSSGTYNTLYSVAMLNASTGYIVGSGGKILKTVDGNNWVNQNPGTSENLYSVYFIDVLTGYASGGYNAGLVLKTINGGTSWTVQHPPQAGANTLNSIFFLNATTGYAVGTNGTILKTTSGGTSWSPQNSGTSLTLNEVKFLDAITGYVVGDNGTILKTTDGGGLIGIVPISNEVPQSFSLYQNYPNPFNPVTKIKFDVPSTSLSFGEGSGVRLLIFDLLGREITTLVNEPLSPGTYEVTWNADTYPTGIYLYRLSAGGFIASKKMILNK